MTGFFAGLSGEDRTPGLLNPIQARYQSALHPVIFQTLNVLFHKMSALSRGKCNKDKYRPDCGQPQKKENQQRTEYRPEFRTEQFRQTGRTGYCKDTLPAAQIIRQHVLFGTITNRL